MEREQLERELEALHEASFAWALRCCGGDRGEAEDVLQTTYLKIVEGRARYRGESAIRTWLFAVIKRTAVDAHRRRERRERVRFWLRRVPRAEFPDAPDRAF